MRSAKTLWPLIFMGALVLLSGCSRSSKEAPVYVYRFYLELMDSPGTWSERATMPVSEASFAIHPQPILAEGDVRAIDLVDLELGRGLQFRFSERAARELYRMSVMNPGAAIVLALNGTPIGFHIMDGPESSGSLIFFLEVPDETLDEMIADLHKSVAIVGKQIKS